MHTTANNLQLYLGVRLAEVPYFRMPLKLVQDTTTVIRLKSDAEALLKRSNKELGKHMPISCTIAYRPQC